MAKTVGDVIDETRIILQDQTVPYRYPDEDLYRYLNNGLYELKRIRPDVWLGSYDEDLPSYTSADSATDLPIPGIFFQPLVLFVAGYAELRDDEFTVDGRAVALLGSFSQQLTLPTSRTG